MSSIKEEQPRERSQYDERHSTAPHAPGKNRDRASLYHNAHNARPANETREERGQYASSGKRLNDGEKQQSAPRAMGHDRKRSSFQNDMRTPNETQRFKNTNSFSAPPTNAHPQNAMAANHRPLITKGDKPVAFSDDHADHAPENLLAGRNPVREAIKSGRDIEKLMVAKGELSGSAREIIAMARDASIVVQTVDRAHLNAMAANHQGMVAIASAFRYASIDELFAKAEQQKEDPLFVVLDGITDPHNVGAMIRSAECAGAHGLILPTRRAAGLTPAAVKASAGAVEHLPVARVTNISKCLETLKARGLWAVAADAAGEPYASVDLTGPLALVVGSEGSGVSRLVLSGCDRRVALPLHGKIDSLNASVACGVLLYEIRRQRG